MLNRLKRSLWRPAAHALGSRHRLAAAATERADAMRVIVSRLGRRIRFRATSGRRTPVSIFLVPEAGLVPFYASHVILARSVMQAGQRALVMSCNGILPMCSMKSAMRVGATASGDTANPACQRCLAQAQVTGEEHGLADMPVESLVSAAERRTIAGILGQYADDVWETTYDGIRFGALAAGETMRWSRRSSRSELTEADAAFGRALLEAALLIYFAVSKLASRYRVTRLSFMGDYSFWLPLQVLADRRNIGLTTIDHGYHNDIDRRMLCLRTGSANVYMRRQAEQWPRHSATPITGETVEKILDDALFRLAAATGLSTHSPTWERLGNRLKDQLGLSHTRKTIVAYSSSMDEFVAVNELMGALGMSYGVDPRPYPDQVSWMRALCAWVGSRPDLQLVIRLHPRIGAGRRFFEPASEYAQLREILSETPDNVLVVWPEDKVSSYNLAEIADAALVAWSTIGLELARFGVPVVSSFPDVCPFPVRSFIAFAETPEAYLAAVEAAVAAPASIDRMTEAFRWTHYAFWSISTDVSDLIPVPDYEEVPSWTVPHQIAALNAVYLDGRDLGDINMEAMARFATPDAERAAMKRVVARLLTLFTGQDPAETPAGGGPDEPDATRLVQRLRALLRTL